MTNANCSTISNENNPQPDPLISMTQVKRLSSLSRSTIERRMKAGQFPLSIQLTPGGRIAWRQSDVLAWIADPLGWGDQINF